MWMQGVSAPSDTRPSRPNPGGTHMLWKLASAALMTLLVALPLAGVPGRAEAAGRKAVKSYYGPFATLRRANEVANYYRQRGYTAWVNYEGSYVFGSRTYSVSVR